MWDSLKVREKGPHYRFSQIWLAFCSLEWEQSSIHILPFIYRSMIECLGPFSPNDGERNGKVPSLPLFSKDKILRTDDSLYRHVLSQSPKECWEREKEGTLWENQESAAWMVHAVVQVGHLHRYKHLAMADSSCMQRGQISPRSGWGPTSDQSSLSLEKVKISINICELPYLVMASLCFFFQNLRLHQDRI